MILASRVLPLRIAREHLDYEIVETIVELLLKHPGKLPAFDFARAEKKNVRVDFRLGWRVTDDHFDAFRGGARITDEQRMVVEHQFCPNFFSKIGHAGI